MGQSTASMEEARAKLFARAIEARQSGDGRPFLIAHFITNRCPCKCPSCLWLHNDWEDVPLADLERFYLEAKEQGFIATALSGGEPFIRKDLGDIVRFIKEEAGMPILLFNTGWYLEERMDEVLPYIDMMLVSLDSARAERHDEIRGLRGLFDRLIKAVDLAKTRYPDISYQFNCCVQKGIANEIDDLLALTEDMGLRISFDVITEYRHGDRGSAFTRTEMGLPMKEQQEVCTRLLEKKRAGSPIVNSEMYFKYFADGRPGYRCHFPKLAMSVDGRGYVEDCLNLDAPIANIREMPLKEIMKLRRFGQLRVDAEECFSCNSPTMVDLSHVWENPQLLFGGGGIEVG
jgi:MoaA/NifB/PqqE/SkfB family radical SAM enzyme